MTGDLSEKKTSKIVRREEQIKPGIRALRITLDHPKVRTFLSVIGMMLIFIALLSIVQFSTDNLTGVDGYFHIRFASIMRTEGLKPGFPWLPLTILNPREYSDHHLLFHIALIPFTLGDLREGAKLAAVLFPAIAFLCIWWLLRVQRVPYSALWALGLLAISEAFIFRMSLVRRQSLTLAVMAVALHWMLTKKYVRLIPLGFVYVWLYDAFPLLLTLTTIYVASILLIERRLELRPLIYCGVGVTLGLVLNPYFPNDIIFAIRHLAPKITETTALDVGNEWYPYQTSQLLENSPLTLVAFFSGVLALGLRERRMETRTATSLFIALLFGLLLLQSRRFIEYFPPFALIFAAFAWSPLLQLQDTNQDDINVSDPSLRFLKYSILGLRWRQVTAVVVLVALLIPGMWLTVRDAQKSVKSSKPYTLFSGASEWLKANTPSGSRVFQTDWDDFPRLFYHNTHNTYLIGLDPTYMQLYNADLYDLWEKITEGDVERPSQFIYDRFGANFVVSDLNHKDFIRRAEEDPGLEEVYRDEESVVYAFK